MSQRLKEMAFQDPEFQRQERENELGPYDTDIPREELVSRLERDLPGIRHVLKGFNDGD